MLSYWLQEKRLSNIRSHKKPDHKNILDMLPVKQGKQIDKFFG